MSGSFWKKKGLLPSAGIGLVGAIVITALLCIIPAVAAQRQAIRMSAAVPCADAVAGLSVLLAVLITARLRGRQAMPTAAIIAGGYIFIAALLCALGGGEAAFGSWLIRLCAVTVVGALLGAVMSIRHNPHKKKRMRKK